jgi:hypothetical protein
MTDTQTRQATYTIGVAARMTGISAHTLRVWERRYQLYPTKRSNGGQREFTMADIHHLKLLKQLVDSGMRIGDIANLPANTLSSLILESGDISNTVEEQQGLISVNVFGTSLCSYFSQYKKRYPNVQFTLMGQTPEDYLNNPTTEKVKGELSILQLNTISKAQIDPLKALSQKNHIIVFYHYASKDIQLELAQSNISLYGGGTDPSRVDDAFTKTLQLKRHMSVLDKNNQQFNLPSTPYPRQFDESELLDASQQADRLHCECPPHLSDLITRLNAFEDYSKTCEADNWHQAAVHACIYAYTNQARYLLEKALSTVLTEQPPE